MREERGVGWFVDGVLRGHIFIHSLWRVGCTVHLGEWDHSRMLGIAYLRISRSEREIYMMFINLVG